LEWRLISDKALRIRRWEDEFVVYNRLSGDTHLLSSSAAQILLQLQESPASQTELAEILIRTHDAEHQDDFMSQMEIILADLDKQQLIERI